jgi:ribosomal protein L7Ae-like RNA K-turn-binding protein
MLSYQKSAPQLRAICEKHGVPYVQQNVFARLGALTDIMIGRTSMREYKPEWEKASDFVNTDKGAVAGVA